MAESQTFCNDLEKNAVQETQYDNWKKRYKILCCGVVVMMTFICFAIPLTICHTQKTNQEEIYADIRNGSYTSVNNSFMENENNKSYGRIKDTKPTTAEDITRLDELLTELKSVGCEPRNTLSKVSDLLPKDSELHHLKFEPQFVILKKCLPGGSFCRGTSAECLSSAVQVKWIPLIVQRNRTESLTYHLEVTEDKSCQCK